MKTLGTRRVATVDGIWQFQLKLLSPHTQGAKSWNRMEPSKQPGQYRHTSWVDARVELHPSPIEGTGMFARRTIVKGEPVVIWGGTVFTEEELRAGKARKHSVAAIGEGLYLAGGLGEPESPDDFMNHSCDPNVWMADDVTLVTMRDISAGEELTADYATWTTDPDWTLPGGCNCGSPMCRRAVTGNDWKLKDLQARYRGHFSPYINHRIDLGETASLDAGPG